MKTHVFRNAIVFNIQHDKQYCETVFPDGKKVPAIPEPDDPPFAKECGYEDRVWDLNWHHEFIHTWLAQEKGMAGSRVLRYVADGNKSPTEWSGQEENEVISIQKKLNGLDVPVVINDYQLRTLRSILEKLK